MEELPAEIQLKLDAFEAEPLAAAFVKPHQVRACEMGGDVRIETQTELNQFGAMRCCRYNGNISIIEAPGTDDPIVDLSPLRSLQVINGDLVVQSNPSLVQFGDTFRCLRTVNLLAFVNNASLTRIGRFDSLCVTRDIVVLANAQLQCIDGFQKLQRIREAFVVLNNPQLQKIATFNNVERIGQGFVVNANFMLSELSGFASLRFTPTFTIVSNVALTVIEGFNSLQKVTMNLTIRANSNVQKIDGFEALKKVGGLLTIGDQVLLTDICAFDVLKTVGGIDFFNNSLLQFLDAFVSLETVGALDLRIFNNDSLLSIDGFANLTSIDSGLEISENDELLDLCGLSALLSVQDTVTVQNNTMLGDFRGLQPLASSADPPPFVIAGNASDPTREMIAAGPRCDAREYYERLLDRLVTQDKLSPCAARIVGCSTTKETIERLRDVDGLLDGPIATLLLAPLCQESLGGDQSLPPEGDPLLLSEPAQSALSDLSFDPDSLQTKVVQPSFIACQGDIRGAPSVFCSCAGADEECPSTAYSLTFADDRTECHKHCAALTRTWTLRSVCATEEPETFVQKVFFC